MDIKTITATLALLGSGVPLTACDSAEKPATETKDAKDADKKDAKGDKGDVKANADEKAEDKGEMACGEGKCGGAGGCGAKKDDKALADGEKKDEAAGEAPKADEDADKS